MKSVSNHSFSLIPRAEIPRSVFDRSHNRKMTLDVDYLVPIFCDEVLPGDSFKLDYEMFARLTSPLTTPVMDNLYLDVFWFFVPNRLVWDNWQKFCGEQENPGDSTDYLIPTIQFSASAEDDSNCPIVPFYGNTIHSGALANCFGLPIFAPADMKDLAAPEQSGKLNVNVLPFRAYNLIYNEWFRDQNLIDSAPVPKGDADFPSLDGSTKDDYSLRKRAKRHDYMTSALPFPQKGPGVELPLGEFAPVSVYTGIDADTVAQSVAGAQLSYDYVRPLLGYGTQIVAFNGTQNVTEDGQTQGFVAGQINWENDGGSANYAGQANSFLAANLSTATAATINTLRTAFQLQRWYERAARGGTRYTEIIRSFFGTISPDARLQRPEYLGGSSTPFIINPISQTSATTEITPQGNLVAIGLTGTQERGFRKSFVEHGYIIGLANVRADVNYQQGVNRMWSRRTRFDFYWPPLAHLGEQAVLNKEIFVQGDEKKDGAEVIDEQVFGYQERWAEYRYSPNEIVGKMNSVAQTNFDIWHLAQYFTELPKLNQEFIEQGTPIDRASAVPAEPDVLLDINFKIRAARPMPVYSVPGLIDHF